jgi:hypothetical protein
VSKPYLEIPPNCHSPIRASEQRALVARLATRDRAHEGTSFAARLRGAKASPSDPWNATLDTITGRVGSDGVERISTELIFEWLDVPPLKRTPEMAERIRGLMVRRGWIPVRARHATSKGHAARVRGYARLVE